MIARASILSSALAGLVVSACSNTPDGEDVVADAIGLARERPGVLVLEDDPQTAATPYGGHGAPVNCARAARDIARLTILLGPDLEAPSPEETDDVADDTVFDDIGDFASDLPEKLPEAATDAAVGAVVGLNPARSAVRFVARSGEIEADARRERELALKRRAWLRGAFDALQCPPATLEAAFAEASPD